MREALGWVEERGENLRVASEGLLEEQVGSLHGVLFVVC
jgi:hypothetical protein